MVKYDENRIGDVNKEIGVESDISSSIDDRATRTYSFDREGILITAGMPWWRCDTVVVVDDN